MTSGGATAGERLERGYWPGLDGVRGLAIAAVVAFHGGTGLVGGALGVDLFLVLSGFLITSLLLEEADASGRVDLRAFWGRRARRLLPALLVLVAVVVVAVAVRPSLAGGYDPRAMRGDALATLGYVANWRFVVEGTGYFAAFAAPSPFRHAWSLGVEEQWYVLWPVAFWAIHRAARGRVVVLVAATGGLAVASALLMSRLAGDIDRAHYGTDTRAQGLLVGALLAVLLHRSPIAALSPGRRAAASAAAWLGLAATVVLMARAGGSWPLLYRGGHLAVAVAGSALVAGATMSGSVLARVFSIAPLRWLGHISYGLYLWHWPIFIWLRPETVELGRWPLFALRVGVALAVSVASYHLVEQPIRRERLRLARRPIAAGLAASALTAVLVVAVGTTATPPVDGELAAFPGTPAEELAGWVAAGAAIDAPGGSDSPLHVPPLARPATDDVLDVMVVGDSSGFTLANHAGEQAGARIVNGAVIGCGLDPAPALVGGQPFPHNGQPVACTDSADYAAHAATADPEIVLVTLGPWEVYDRALPGGDRLEVGTTGWHEWLRDSLDHFARRMAAAAPHAWIVVTEVPCYAEVSGWLGGPDSARNDPRRVAAVNGVVDEVLARYPDRLARLSLADDLCPDGRADATLGGDLLRPDGVHVSGPATPLLWDQVVLPQLRALASGPSSESAADS